MTLFTLIIKNSQYLKDKNAATPAFIQTS